MAVLRRRLLRNERLETVYKGNTRPWGKTKKSLSVIHIPPTLAKDLRAWKTECLDLAPEAFIFANQAGSFLDTDNFRKRVLHKIARDLKLPKLTFQVIRRTIATLAQKKGTVKDVRVRMRHSCAATTTDAYMQEVTESVQSTVNSLHLELRRNTRTVHRKGSSSRLFGGKKKPPSTNLVSAPRTVFAL